MHFLVQTVQAKFPEIVNFDSELRFLEKAAVGKKYCSSVDSDDFFFFDMVKLSLRLW